MTTRKAFETGKNNQLLSDGVFDYKYDDEGNRIEKKAKTGETTKFVWDHRNRLVHVLLPKESVTYSYDHRNRMTRRNSEYVVHDGWQIVLTLDAKGNVKDRNLWGANQDELIATNDQFTLCDHLGSVRDVVDATDKVQKHVEYNAFGQIMTLTGQSNCIFGYTGKMFDIATGLQWNINRWYDAKVGRWCSEDPIGFKSKDENLYRYVNNSPLRNVDLMGHHVTRRCLCCALSLGALTLSQGWGFGLVGYWDHDNDETGGNAMRHCIASCKTAQLCGKECAREFWDGREEGNGIDEQQDRANNSVGRDLGAGRLDTNCTLECLIAWSGGSLKCQEDINGKKELVPCPPPTFI